jgi:hypothetical protein
LENLEEEISLLKKESIKEDIMNNYENILEENEKLNNQNYQRNLTNNYLLLRNFSLLKSKIRNTSNPITGNKRTNT